MFSKKLDGAFRTFLAQSRHYEYYKIEKEDNERFIRRLMNISDTLWDKEMLRGLQKIRPR